MFFRSLSQDQMDFHFQISLVPTLKQNFIERGYFTMKWIHLFIGQNIELFLHLRPLISFFCSTFSMWSRVWQSHNNRFLHVTQFKASVYKSFHNRKALLFSRPGIKTSLKEDRVSKTSLVNALFWPEEPIKMVGLNSSKNIINVTKRIRKHL